VEGPFRRRPGDLGPYGSIFVSRGRTRYVAGHYVGLKTPARSAFFLGLFSLDPLAEVKGKVTPVAFPQPERIESGDFDSELHNLVEGKPTSAGFELADAGLRPADADSKRRSRGNPLRPSQHAKALSLRCEWIVRLPRHATKCIAVKLQGSHPASRAAPSPESFQRLSLALIFIGLMVLRIIDGDFPESIKKLVL
jgi:hypothetical protein